MGTLAALGLALTALASQAGEPPDPMSPPSAGGEPVEVAIGFYAQDFARITARDESFDLTGYLELSWRDPRLAAADAATAAKPGKVRRLDPARVWTPRVFFENALEQPKLHDDPVVEVDPSGLVTRWSIVSGKFSSAMDLRAFPFDRQVIEVRVGSFDDVDTVKFTATPELIHVGDGAFITDWTIDRPSASVDQRRYVPGREAYPRLVYSVHVARRSTFYVWRVLVPLTLLTLVSWASFWFEPENLQPQISTCTAALISMVAFNFSIDFSLPKVGYLTMIDKHALIGFAFVALSVAAVTAIHAAVYRDRMPLALSVQRSARWAFLPAYAAAVLLNLGATQWGR